LDVSIIKYSGVSVEIESTVPTSNWDNLKLTSSILLSREVSTDLSSSISASWRSSISPNTSCTPTKSSVRLFNEVSISSNFSSTVLTKLVISLVILVIDASTPSSRWSILSFSLST
jgi:hypothetical protein